MNNRYVNQYDMKKKRKKVITEDTKCEKCGAKATKLHHVDKTKTNHSDDNFLVLCDKSHSEIHKNDIVNMPVKKLNIEAIKALLCKIPMNQGEFAEKLGMTKSTLSTTLRKATTKNSTIKKMAEILGCTAEDILSQEYKEKIKKVSKQHLNSDEYINDNKHVVYIKFNEDDYERLQNCLNKNHRDLTNQVLYWLDSEKF